MIFKHHKCTEGVLDDVYVFPHHLSTTTDVQIPLYHSFFTRRIHIDKLEVLCGNSIVIKVLKDWPTCLYIMAFSTKIKKFFRNSDYIKLSDSRSTLLMLLSVWIQFLTLFKKSLQWWLFGLSIIMGHFYLYRAYNSFSWKIYTVS